MTELESIYSINDVADMNDALDAWHEATAAAQKR